MKNELTVKEAIKEGFTFCGRPAEQWQQLTTIDDLGEIDFEDGEYFLAEKEGEIFTFNKEQIGELLADVIASNEADDTGRDDEEIYNNIKALDFTETEELLKTVFEKHKTYKLTDIKLVWGKLNN